MAGIASWTGGTEHWRHLALRYAEAPSLDMARKLVEEDRIQSWIFFNECLYQQEWVAGATGMQALGESKAVPHLKRALDAQPVSTVALRAILQAMASLRAFEPLCVMAADPSVPVQMRLEVLTCLSHYPHPRNARLFLDMLESPQQRCQHLAIEVLGRWQVADAVSVLAEMAREHPTASRLERLVLALAQIPLVEARDVLRELLLSPHAEQQIQVAEWLLQHPHEDFVGLLQLAIASVPTHSSESEALQDILVRLQSALKDRVKDALRPFLLDLEEQLFVSPSEPTPPVLYTATRHSHAMDVAQGNPDTVSSAWGAVPPEAEELEACLSTLSSLPHRSGS